MDDAVRAARAVVGHPLGQAAGVVEGLLALVVPRLDALVGAGHGAERATGAVLFRPVEHHVAVPALVQVLGELDQALGARDDAASAALAAGAFNLDVSHGLLLLRARGGRGGTIGGGAFRSESGGRPAAGLRRRALPRPPSRAVACGAACAAGGASISARLGSSAIVSMTATPRTGLPVASARSRARRQPSSTVSGRRVLDEVGVGEVARHLQARGRLDAPLDGGGSPPPCS